MHLIPPVKVRDQGCVSFPLTPALSLRERETRFRREDCPWALGHSAGLDDGSPLPRGEGQGEGEQRQGLPRASDDSRNRRTARVFRQSRSLPNTTDTGLYLDGKRIVPLTNGAPISATLPPSAMDRLRLELRCQGWVPQKVVPGSQDPRTLGVQVFSVTMRAAGAGPRTFNANTCSGSPPRRGK